MNIVQYNDTYNDIGGTEVYCAQLLDQLAQQGHRVSLLANGTAAAKAANHIVLPTSQGAIDTWRSKYFFNKKNYTAFKDALQKLQPDVVHLHQNRYHTYELLYALRDLKIPVVQTIHDYTILCPSQFYPQPYFKNARPCQMDDCNVICSQNNCIPLSKRLIYKAFHDKRRAYIRATIPTFIAPTRKLKQLLEAANFQNITHLPFYIDESKWHFNQATDKSNLIIFIGRVEENKGILYLVETIQKLQQQIPDVQLLIIGDGSQVEPIRQSIKQQNLNFIQLIGKVNREVLKTHLKNAKIAVVPTLDMEQFALVGIEAMASGVNVIGSNRGGIPEWCLHNQTGLLFEPNKTGDLLQQLTKMIQNPTLAQKLKKGGQHLLQTTYDKEQHFSKLLTIYKAAKVLV